MIVLHMPYPPTSNHNTTVVNGRRIMSPKYRAWRREAEMTVRLSARGQSIAGPYTIEYVADRPDRRRRDIENLPKSLGDALQEAGVIRDDADCQASLVRWAAPDPVALPIIRVTITPLGAA